jgi:Ca2+-binding RTX toxin-like protein
LTTVTVSGAHNTPVALSFDRDANAELARHVASIISAGLSDHTIVVVDNAGEPKFGGNFPPFDDDDDFRGNGDRRHGDDGDPRDRARSQGDGGRSQGDHGRSQGDRDGVFTPPPLPAGKIGEVVVSQPGTVILPPGYDFVVDSAQSATVFGNGDANQRILAGGGNLTFIANGGSGSVITGGGDNLISIAGSDTGDWLIAVGNGDDTIRALSTGSNTISAGSGHNFIQLGAGTTLLTTEGSGTVVASSGSETIDAGGSGTRQVVIGNASNLYFVGGDAVTVFGGSGSDTVSVMGGSGNELLEGGSAGNNVLQAGDGRATLFGGGDGDQLFAAGSRAQALHAGVGNETLSGAAASGQDTFFGGSGSDLMIGGAGKNTFVAGTGADTIMANPNRDNLFEFMKSMGGGAEVVQNLTDASQVHIELMGYGRNEIRRALEHQTTTNGSVTITLTDNTSVTFQNIGHLTSANFVSVQGQGDDRDDPGRDGHSGGGHHGERS